MFDVVIIGAGVSGCAIARELSRLDCSVCVLEREEDVCCGTSKANSAIVHAGFDAEPGSLMARLNVEGNRLMYELSRDLDFRCDQCGSLVVCVSEADMAGLELLRQRGEKNGVEGLRIIDRDELLEMEPNISDEAVGALWAPTGGIVDPFQLTVALAENAAANGVEFRFCTPVTAIEREDGAWSVTAGGDVVRAKAVVNAAGVYADDIHNMFVATEWGKEATGADGAPTVSREPLTIVPRKGEYYLLDTTAGSHLRHTIFMLPTIMGKGVLVSPTVHGNLIVGPTATDIDDKEAVNTTPGGLAEVSSKCSLTVKNVPLREVITTFAGLRAHQKNHDFVIGEIEGAEGLFDCAAIESPGLTSAPAVGRMVAGMVRQRLGLAEKAGWIGTRVGIPRVSDLSFDEWNELCEKDKAYGNVICRCCRVTEAQIVEAIRRTPGARSLDAIKRRTFATAGRCQGGFCTPKIMEILERELGVPASEVTKRGPGSELVVGTNKDRLATPDADQRGGEA
ncbi:MAG: NAD(P)/FAD-dependent oxidoreductase [Atopobiaceae bacterium]|nr:NAD(P)/FAD-dependent oxidoreductase [Atopobiaceae bacterium]